MVGGADSVLSRLLAYAARRPAAPAIIDERRTLTYAEFSRSVVTAAGRLHEFGVRARDTVAVSLGAGVSGNELGSIVYAVGYLGAAVLPLYPDFPPMRRAWLAQRFAAKWLVDRLGSASPSGVALLPLEELTVPTETATLFTSPRGDTPESPFHYQFSSGTTGDPKVVLFSHRHLCSNSLATLAHYGLGE